jgi:type IV pilus assembly protein PilE
MMKAYARQVGFTLIELMIVVAIVAIISAIAYPSYMNYVVNTKRSAATTTLLQVADLQQQFFMDNKRYAANLTELGYAANPLVVDDQGNSTAADDTAAVYSVSLSNVAATTYTITAAPLNQQLKKDTKCGSLTLDQRGAEAASSGSDDCW